MAIKNYFFEGEEEKEEDENEDNKEEEEESKDPVYKQIEQKLWKDLGSLMSKDSKIAQTLRKDTFEGAEMSLAARKAIELKKAN